MSNRDLLLEIGIEEMPARFILGAADAFEAKLLAWLEEKRITHGEVRVFSTPRRLAILVKEVAEFQQDIEQEAKGPAKKVALDDEGNWSKAAIGFSRSQGMTADDIFFKEIKGVEYAHINKFIEGVQTITLLPEMGELIASLHFPNSMRWGSMDLRFVRPIRWIVALFGNETVPFSVANIQTSSTTDGHRFLGEEIPVDTPADYEKVLLDQFVIADYEARKQVIEDQINQLSNEKNGLFLLMKT